MSANVTAYEVRVKVRGKKPREYNSRHGCFIYDEVIKMFHKFARTPQQAMNKCRKYGTPVSAHKVNVQVMHKDFEQLPILNSVYVDGNPYNSALAMDELIWQKRNKRRENMHRDKEE